MRGTEPDDRLNMAPKRPRAKVAHGHGMADLFVKRPRKEDIDMSDELSASFTSTSIPAEGSAESAEGAAASAPAPLAPEPPPSPETPSATSSAAAAGRPHID